LHQKTGQNVILFSSLWLFDVAENINAPPPSWPLGVKRPKIEEPGAERPTNMPNSLGLQVVWTAQRRQIPDAWRLPSKQFQIK
jgi:hypothetical protein